MQGRIIFLLEEPSMRTLLDELLPRLFPGWVDGEHFQCVPHQGKSDLDRSIARKLAAWRIPGDRFVILRDTDGADCIDLKARLTALCRASGRPDSLVRLVCQELESWYLGDLAALAAAFEKPSADSPRTRKRYLSPDEWHKPSVEVRKLVSDFQKIGGARQMGQRLSRTGNRSCSFRVFVEGVEKIAIDLGYRADGQV